MNNIDARQQQKYDEFIKHVKKVLSDYQSNECEHETSVGFDILRWARKGIFTSNDAKTKDSLESYIKETDVVFDGFNIIRSAKAGNIKVK